MALSLDARKEKIRDVIYSYGGVKLFAKVCGVSIYAVRRWIDRAHVPPKHWAVIVKASKEQITYKTLASLNQ